MGDVTFIGIEIYGDGFFAREVEALGAESELVDLSGGGSVPQNCGESALVENQLASYPRKCVK